MKKRLIFSILIFGLMICLVSASDVIIKLSSPTNAHGELANQNNYGVNITYSDVFGSPYNPIRDTPNNCEEGNTVLKLSSPTNAHAEDKIFTNYSSNVCYGDLFCHYTTSACAGVERCVVTLSSESNAHLSKCNEITGSYQNKICCASPWASGLFTYEGDDCETLTNKSSCLAPANNCTWTPPGTTNVSDGGGCCGYQQRWNVIDQICTDTQNLCTNVFDPANPKLTISGLDPENDRYCAKITSGLSYGFWYPTEFY